MKDSEKIKEIEEIEEIVNNMSKEDILNFFKNLKSGLAEQTDDIIAHQVNFEVACVEGDYVKVEKMLKDVKYLSKKQDYINDQIEYVEEEIEMHGNTEGLTKVLEILRSYCK